MATLLYSISLVLLPLFSLADGGSIGVNYGRIGGDLPSAFKVTNLLKSQGINRIRVYDTDPAVLKSLSGTGIKIDAVFAAMTALKYDDIPLVVSETGWPSKGDDNEIGASVENAAAYNGNLIKRVLTGGGTPLRPKANLTVFLFALFNENKKPGPESERNYGLFYPNMEKVYNIPFTVEGLKDFSGEISPVSGGNVVRDLTPVQRGGNGSGKTWCVAKDVGKDKLQSGLDYACGEGGADCRAIQPGATCYDPDTLEAHASFAFNSYYQKMGRAASACDFDGAAYVVTELPRFGNCEFSTGY
ncbi:putative glucan endo-1,3-beta-D-glucosidase [Helianthus debilis subsp. tardiflorus]